MSLWWLAEDKIKYRGGQRIREIERMMGSGSLPQIRNPNDIWA
jgi:hypothetical protein